MHIMTKDGWVALQPLYRGNGCYTYPNAKEPTPPRMENGIPAPHHDKPLMFEGVPMYQASIDFILTMRNKIRTRS